MVVHQRRHAAENCAAACRRSLRSAPGPGPSPDRHVPWWVKVILVVRSAHRRIQRHQRGGRFLGEPRSASPSYGLKAAACARAIPSGHPRSNSTALRRATAPSKHPGRISARMVSAGEGAASFVVAALQQPVRPGCRPGNVLVAIAPARRPPATSKVSVTGDEPRVLGHAASNSGNPARPCCCP